jgi:hypothetical protein
MKHYVEHVKDAIGQNYLGIKIDKLEVLPFLDKLNDYKVIAEKHVR